MMMHETQTFLFSFNVALIVLSQYGELLIVYRGNDLTFNMLVVGITSPLCPFDVQYQHIEPETTKYIKSDFYLCQSAKQHL